MKMILTLFMLAVFAMFISVDRAEAILDLESDTFPARLEAEPVSLAPNAIVLEVRAVTVSNVLKWPHGYYGSPGLDDQHPHDNCFSTAEGRVDRAHIRSGGASRFG